MKNYIVFFITLLVYNLSIAQIVNIPDPVFKNVLVNTPCVDTNNDGLGDVDADTNDDGNIQVTEAEAVQRLYFDNNNIVSLEGLQSFISLLSLGFGGNNITSIDLSQLINLETLAFGDVQLVSIDLSQNTNLLDLRIGESQIISLNLENNLQLVFLDCHHSPIENINLSQNINLITLGCTYTPLTEIDLSQNINLEEVLIRFNQLTSLDISNLPNLKKLNFNLNQVTELDVSNNPNLESLIADNNLITSLDITNNPNLFRLTLINNSLTSLNLKNGFNNNMFKMHAQDNPALTCIQVDDISYPSTQVCTSWDGWCKDETAIYSEDCNLGLEEVLESQLSIYPNPAKDVLYLYNESVSEISCLKVYDALGKLVLKEYYSFNQIDISDLATGLLFVKIETDKGLITKKIIKQ